MTAAFVFSVCSTSDAFIARTFTNQFSTGSIIGFLVLGPMIDVKNMLVLLSSFRKSFVVKLVAVVPGWARYDYPAYGGPYANATAMDEKEFLGNQAEFMGSRLRQI